MAQKRACDACYKRKIQCDIVDGQKLCDWCGHHGLACTFNRVRGRRKAATKRAVSSPVPEVPLIQKRPGQPTQARLESSSSLPNSALQGTSIYFNDSHSPLKTHSPSYKDSVAFCQINYNGCNFGHLSHQNGIPLLSEEGRRWIASRTGEEVSFERFELPISPPSWFLAHEHFANPVDFLELPHKSLVDTIFDTFIHSAFSMVFPVVDKVLFQETIDLAYGSQSDSKSIKVISAKTCVLAFMSTISMFEGRNNVIPQFDVENCAVKARYLLATSLEDASLTTLQALVMMSLYDAISGRVQSASMFQPVACRIVFKLGAHVDLPPKHIITRGDRELKQARLLFWLTYILDKDIALRTGQPPLISGEYCDLSLPDGYVDCYDYIPHLDDRTRLIDNEALTPHLPEDPRLSSLKEKVSRRLYSAQAAKKTNAELLRDIRELDEELEAWRLSIPITFRPALSISNKSAIDVGIALPRSMHQITLCLGYHHLMTAIHRASGRCMSRAKTAADAEEWLSGVLSSMDLALEASRSTLVFLRAAIRGVAGEAFWIIVFYPTVAMMVLFCNILMCPLNPKAEEDLSILESTADLIHSLPIQHLTSREVEHLELVTEFVAELSSLSKKAIAKATAECEQRC